MKSKFTLFTFFKKHIAGLIVHNSLVHVIFFKKKKQKSLSFYQKCNNCFDFEWNTLTFQHSHFIATFQIDKSKIQPIVLS